MLPLIIGLDGETLSHSEAGFIREAEPAGFILFGRNIRSPEQLRALTDELRAASGRDRLLILIDQEGGRVARLGPPDWPSFPAPARFGQLYAKAPISAIEAARLNGRIMAETLRGLGITANAFPVLDLLHPGADPVIGDRAFAADPLWVSALGVASMEGLTAGGVAAVIKHLPGHGRAGADSHQVLPMVAAEAEALAADLQPFRACRSAPFAMVAHVLYQAWDAANPASQSAAILRMIREELDYQGLLVSDDLVMDALGGPVEERARRFREAGGDLALVGRSDGDMRARLAGSMAPAGPDLPARLEGALTIEAEPADVEALVAARDALLAFA